MELPPGATLLATSETASNEIWLFQDNVLAAQCHPEFTPELAIEKIWGFLKDEG